MYRYTFQSNLSNDQVSSVASSYSHKCSIVHIMNQEIQR